MEINFHKIYFFRIYCIQFVKRRTVITSIIIVCHFKAIGAENYKLNTDTYLYVKLKD